MKSCYNVNVIEPTAIVPYTKLKEKPYPIIKRKTNTLISRVHDFFAKIMKKPIVTDLIIMDQRLTQYDNTRKLYGRELISRIRDYPYWSGVLLKRPHLRREFTFTDYRKAIIFINLVAEEALLASHFPKIINCRLKVAVTLRTVEVDGISNKDFDLAKAIDVIAEKVQGLLK